MVGCGHETACAVKFDRIWVNRVVRLRMREGGHGEQV